MKKDLYSKIIYICLFLLAVLPLGSAFNLTWKELARLFVITLGLLYLYVRYFRTASPQTQGAEGPGNLEPNKPRTSNFQPLLLSVVYIFIITQFDPATSAVNSIIPQSTLNWFFIASSALIFVAFGAFLLRRFGVVGRGNLEPRTLNFEPDKPRTSNLEQKAPFSFLDKFVLVAGSIIIVSLAITKMFILREVEIGSSLWSVLKIIELMMLYFVVVKITGRKYRKSIERTDSQKTVFNVQKIFVVAISTFALVLAIGVYKNTKAIISYARGAKLIETGNTERGVKLLRSIGPTDLYFDKSQLSLKKALPVLHSKKHQFGLAYEEIKYLSNSDRDSVVSALSDCEASYLMGIFHFYGLQFEKAIPFLSKALTYYPKDLRLLFKLAKAYEYSNNIDLALSQIRKIKDIDPENITALYYEGYYNYVKGNVDATKEIFSKGIESAKDEGGGEFYKGMLYYLEKKIDASIASFERSEELGFKKDYLFLNLGKFYSEKEMWYESIKAYTIVFRLSPWMPEIRKGLISSLNRYNEKYGLRGLDFSENLVYNSGFEKGREGWVDYTPTAHEIRVVHDQVHSGHFATLLEGEKFGYHGGRYQPKAMGENELYYYGCWVKAENIDQLKVTLLYWDMTGHYTALGTITKGCDWRKYDYFFITPPQSNDPSVGFYPALLYNIGKVWIDDVTLKRYQINPAF